MSRLIEHQFQTGQRWKNPGYILYILGVNEDVKNEDGTPIEPGKICVSEEKPFPGRQMKATDLSPASMEEVVQKGGYALMEEGWTPEFMLAKKAIDEAKAAAGIQDADPPKPPRLSGLGAMMQ